MAEMDGEERVSDLRDEITSSAGHARWLTTLERLTEGDLSAEEERQLREAAATDEGLARIVALYAPLGSAELRRARPSAKNIRAALGPKKRTSKSTPERARRAWWVGGGGLLAAASAAVVSLVIVGPFDRPPRLEARLPERVLDPVEPVVLEVEASKTLEHLSAHLLLPDEAAGSSPLPWVFERASQTFRMTIRASGLTLHRFGAWTVRLLAGPSVCAGADPLRPPSACALRDLEVRVRPPDFDMALVVAKVGTLGRGSPPERPSTREPADRRPPLTVPEGAVHVEPALRLSEPANAPLQLHLFGRAGVETSGSGRWIPLGTGRHPATRAEERLIVPTTRLAGLEEVRGVLVPVGAPDPDPARVDDLYRTKTFLLRSTSSKEQRRDR